LARGEYIVLLNNDTVVDKYWLSELIKGVMSEKDIVCCASKILHYDKKDTINSAGGKITPIGGGFSIGYGDKNRLNYSNLAYTGFGCGAGVLVKKDFFNFVGGLDEDYFITGEEVDLGLKAWLFGYKVLYVPTAIMYHKEGGTFGKSGGYPPKRVYLITRNRLYTLTKNLEFQNVMYGLILGIFFDFYQITQYIRGKKTQHIKSIFAAYRDFVKNLSKTLKKRASIQKNRHRRDRDLYRFEVMSTLLESIREEKRLRAILRGDDHNQ